MFFEAGPLGNQVHLVPYDRERNVAGDFRSGANHFGRQNLSNVHHPQHPVGVLDRPLRASYTLGLHGIVRRPEARGIGDADRQPVH